jgi:prepilin-type N-terminal cleavage/methylation domain-containing protein
MMSISGKQSMTPRNQVKHFRRLDESSGMLDQAGFTIIELLIATVVFSMVIVVILYGVLSFTHAYYSGIDASTTQDTARNVLNSIADSIEFSGDTINRTPFTFPGAGGQVYFCAGGMTYVYNWGQMYGGTPSLSNPGLYATPGSCVVPGSIPTANGQELLAPNMRVTILTVTPNSTNRLYNIILGLAYGTGDLLCNVSKGSAAGGCNPNASLNSSTANVTVDPTDLTDTNDIECRRTTGSEFCAHAGLSTTVSLRVAGSALN